MNNHVKNNTLQSTAIPIEDILEIVEISPEHLNDISGGWGALQCGMDNPLQNNGGQDGDGT